jgi:hypothetical protein
MEFNCSLSRLKSSETSDSLVISSSSRKQKASILYMKAFVLSMLVILEAEDFFYQNHSNFAAHVWIFFVEDHGFIPGSSRAIFLLHVFVL